jgi:hypothetical protein
MRLKLVREADKVERLRCRRSGVTIMVQRTVEEGDRGQVYPCLLALSRMMRENEHKRKKTMVRLWMLHM